jgi:membrane protease YdiL (CAAX protease family)
MPAANSTSGRSAPRRISSSSRGFRSFFAACKWKQIGFARYRNWTTTLLLGMASGVALELFDLFAKQRLLTRVLGKPPDLASFLAVHFALLMIALLWILAGYGEELVYRGYLMNRVADLFGCRHTAWIASLLLVGAQFGFAHYPQGLTGIIEEGSDGLVLGLMYLARAAISPFPSRGSWSLRHHGHHPAFPRQVSRSVRKANLRPQMQQAGISARRWRGGG